MCTRYGRPFWRSAGDMLSRERSIRDCQKVDIALYVLNTSVEPPSLEEQYRLIRTVTNQEQRNSLPSARGCPSLSTAVAQSAEIEIARQPEVSLMYEQDPVSKDPVINSENLVNDRPSDQPPCRPLSRVRALAWPSEVRFLILDGQMRGLVSSYRITPVLKFINLGGLARPRRSCCKSARLEQDNQDNVSKLWMRQTHTGLPGPIPTMQQYVLCFCRRDKQRKAADGSTISLQNEARPYPRQVKRNTQPSI